METVTLALGNFAPPTPAPRCYACKKPALRVEARTVSRTLDGQRYEAMIPADVCGACGEATFAADDLGRFEEAVTLALVDVGAGGPDAVRWLRKRAGLSGVALASALDVTPETVSRWESGKHPVDRATVFVLGVLALATDAERAALLARLRAPHASAA